MMLCRQKQLCNFLQGVGREGTDWICRRADSLKYTDKSWITPASLASPDKLLAISAQSHQLQCHVSIPAPGHWDKTTGQALNDKQWGQTLFPVPRVIISGWIHSLPKRLDKSFWYSPWLYWPSELRQVHTRLRRSPPQAQSYRLLTLPGILGGRTRIVKIASHHFLPYSPTNCHFCVNCCRSAIQR